MSVAPKPTPKASVALLLIYLGKTVDERCCQIAASQNRKLANITKIGRPKKRPANTEYKVKAEPLSAVFINRLTPTRAVH